IRSSKSEKGFEIAIEGFEKDHDVFIQSILMACAVPHSYDEIKTMVRKEIQEDRVRQLAMMNLAQEFNDASIAKDELGKAYEKCRDITLEQHLLPNFTKVQAASLKRNLCRIHAPWQGARVQWKFQFPLHSCSLAGSTSAMKVSNWGGHLHFREVRE
ncbi:hypothetical protein Tco_1472423, partial [Tanacetum coccineum]